MKQPSSLPSTLQSSLTKPAKNNSLRWGASITLVILVTILIQIFHLDRGFANVSLLYLLLVFLLSIYVGRSAAILSAVLAFFAFNWFFVEPRYTFAVKSANEWLTLCMLLTVSIITGHLTARLKSSEEEARRKQLETETLASASWAVSSQITTEEALTEVLKQIAKLTVVDVAAVASREKEGMVIRACLGEDRENLLTEMNNGLEPQQDENKVTLQTGQGAIYLKLAQGQKLDESKRTVLDALLNHAAVILQREELTRKQTKLEAIAEADTLKTALLSMVTHDFRSPLTGIKAAVSVLQEESTTLRPVESNEMKLLLQGIEQETDRLNRMIGNILDMSKLEAGAWRPLAELSDLNEIVGASLSGFSEEENKRIELNIAPELREVMLDPVQIEQVIKNLVENALKYSPQESKVTIRIKQLESGTQLEVSDRGKGIKSDAKPKIFDRFFRAEGLSESTIPGVGVGLAICKALVEAHNGKIEALDNPEGGTIMRVTLPNQAFE